MKAQNNAGNGYFAVLPNNEETEKVLAYLRKHLSPDRRIKARGQGTPTNGKTWRSYPYGLPKSVASHVRLYLSRDKCAETPKERIAQGRARFWSLRSRKLQDDILSLRQENLALRHKLVSIKSALTQLDGIL